MKSQYMNNSHQQKARAKHNTPKYIKPLATVPTPRGEKPDKIQWYLDFDPVIFRVGYYVGTPRLVRM
jgi:hypothetical protein